MKGKKHLFMFALIVMLATVLSGCSGGKEAKNEEDALAGNTLTEDALEDDANSQEAVYGGSIIVGITQDLDSLDPHKAVAAGTREVLGNIFEGLYKVDSDGELVPAVASSYDVSDDGLKYTFHIRDGILFHNGEAVTAKDVVYSIKRCAGLLEDEDASVSVISALSIISEINIVDDQTVEVVLSEPNTELLGYMTFAIIPEDYTEQDTAPVGTGPFKFVSYEQLGSIVLEKNEDYYEEGVPYLDKVTFKIFSNTDSAFSELLAGTIDLFPYLTESQASQLQDIYNVEVGSSNLVQALFLNNAVEPFDNEKVREALCYAIDRQQILDLVAGGEGSIIGSNMFPNFKVYYNSDLETAYTYDVEKAKELLTEAGYPDGFSFTITVPSNYQFHVDTAQVIVEQLKQVGITADIQLVEWNSWLNDVYMNRDYQATVVCLDSNDMVPSSILLRYNSDSSKNFVNYSNSEYDKLYQEAVSTTDEDEKIADYKQLQTYLSEDAASVYIQDPAKLVAISKNLGGYQFYPIYFQDMSSLYYVGEAENH